MQKRKAVVLLSGGLDSSTTIAVASQSFVVYALTFRYGQRHSSELNAAREIATNFGVAEHRIVDIDLGFCSQSALVGNVPVPKLRRDEEIAHGIPVTYVPARNTVFLSYALAWAEVIGATDIFIGVNAIDYSGYPDCRPEYIAAFQSLANLATKAAVEGHQALTIHTPLIHLSKAEIIMLGNSLGVDYSQTVTCYDPGDTGLACGECDACQLRHKGFTQAGIPDVTRYRTTGLEVS